MQYVYGVRLWHDGVWQMEQLRSELLQERASKQDLECDKIALDRQVNMKSLFHAIKHGDSWGITKKPCSFYMGFIWELISEHSYTGTLNILQDSPEISTWTTLEFKKFSHSAKRTKSLCKWNQVNKIDPYFHYSRVISPLISFIFAIITASFSHLSLCL